MMPGMSQPLPYKIAVLCYLFDEQGHVLLLHRRKPPNEDLFSPIGGKLEQAIGESPTTCAQREIREETGLDVAIDDLYLTGMVSENAFGGDTHWLMFLYEVTKPIPAGAISKMTFDEGVLEWHDRAKINDLSIPETDREVIWPLFWKYRGSFFAAHIDCSGDSLQWRLEQGRPELGDSDANF